MKSKGLTWLVAVILIMVIIMLVLLLISDRVQ